MLPPFFMEVNRMAEPITLVEAKSHLRVIFDDDDSYITALISAARQYAEQYQNRVYVEPDPTVTADEMPFMEKCACLLMIGHWYENRSAVSAEKDMREIPLGVKDILNLRRNIPI